MCMLHARCHLIGGACCSIAGILYCILPTLVTSRVVVLTCTLLVDCTFLHVPPHTLLAVSCMSSHAPPILAS